MADLQVAQVAIEVAVTQTHADTRLAMVVIEVARTRADLIVESGQVMLLSQG